MKRLAASAIALSMSLAGYAALAAPVVAQTEGSVAPLPTIITSPSPDTLTPMPSGDFKPMEPREGVIPLEAGQPRELFRPGGESDSGRMPLPYPDNRMPESINGEQGQGMSARDKQMQEQQSKMQMNRAKQSARSLTQVVKMYEKQLAKLVKQNITAPNSITEAIAKAKQFLDGINNATTAEAVAELDFDEFQTIMQDLEEGRRDLEMLSRWPKTLKQIDQQLKRMNSELKKSKTLVDRLAKKDINLADTYTKYAEAVAKLQSVRNEAAAKVQAGNAVEAFDLLENDFFGNMEDGMQHQRVIQMMSNLSRFTTEYKRGMADLDKKIKQLDRKKVNVTDLKELQAEAKTKGEEILSLIKTKDFDPDEIMGLMEEMEGFRSQFNEKMEDKSGDMDMPWEQGRDQFKPVSFPTTFKPYTKSQHIATP